MALPPYTAISTGQIDAGSPVDETLMDAIVDRDDYLRTTSETLFWINYSQGI